MRALAAALFLVLVAVGSLSAQAPLPPITPLPETDFQPVPTPSRASAPPPTVITDTQGPQPTRPTVVVPTPRLIVIEPQKPPAVATGGSNSLSGRASWYCKAGVSPCYRGFPDGPGVQRVAAAGPKLRVAMGGGVATTAPDPWRNKTVYVNGESVVLRDWCACLGGSPHEKIIDLYYDIFKITGGQVTITW